MGLNAIEEKTKKRKLSLMNIENLENEPARKCRKLNKTNGVKATIPGLLEGHEDEIVDKNFQKFLDNFATPTEIYRCLARRKNIFILQRNLENLMKRDKNDKPTLKQVADHLSTVRFHENCINNKTKPYKVADKVQKVIIKFDRFLDSKIHKGWKTVKANLYIDVIYLCYDRRKGKKSVTVERLLENRNIKCNQENTPHTTVSQEIDLGAVVKQLQQLKAHKVVLNFKILAKEIKLGPRASSDKSTEYPVTYDSFLPIYTKSNDHTKQHNVFSLSPGRYELFTTVTDMECCDDSMFSMSTVCGHQPGDADIDEEGEEDKGEVSTAVKRHLESNWRPTPDDVMNDDSLPARIVFGVDRLTRQNSRTILPTKRMSTRSQPLPPIINMESSNGPDSEPSPLAAQDVKMHIGFCFFVDSTIVQWTRIETVSCPWCSRKFRLRTDAFECLQRLMHHLTNWHSKFQFTCDLMNNSEGRNRLESVREKEKLVRIQVCLSTPVAELSMVMGYGSNKNGKICRRMPNTEMIFCNYKSVNPAVIVRENHNRQYYHSWTTEKLSAAEFDIDSESEEYYGWMKELYYRRTEEFLDINQSEKYVIELWNDAMLSYGVYVAENRLSNFLTQFICHLITRTSTERLAEIAKLRNTLMLHLANLVDFGAVPVSSMVHCMRIFDTATQPETKKRSRQKSSVLGKLRIVN